MPIRLLPGTLTAQLRHAATSGPFTALRHHDFQRFATGQTISMVGTWMQTIAQGWLVLELTGSAFDVGLVTTFNTLPILLFTLYGGVVADRVDKRWFIIMLQSAMLVTAAMLAWLTLAGDITVGWIFGLALVSGLATAFEVPTRQAFLVDLVPPEDLVSAAALNSTIYNLARMMGPAIAGVILAMAGPGICFAINAVSYTAVLVALYRIETRPERARQAGHASIFDGMRFIGSRPILKALSWQMVLGSVFAISFIPILPVYARDVLGTGASGYGALISAVGVGAALGAVIIGWFGRRIPRSHMASYGAIALATSVIVLAILRSFPLALICTGLAGAGMTTTSISTATSLQLESKPELRGRVMAVYTFVVLGLAPVGAFQAGWLAEHLSTPIAIAVSGAIALVGALMLRSRLLVPVEVENVHHDLA